MLRTRSGELWIATEAALFRQRKSAVWKDSREPGCGRVSRTRALCEAREGRIMDGGNYGLTALRARRIRLDAAERGASEGRSDHRAG